MKLLALMKKEFLRFFRDPKLIVSVLIPGVIIYVLYSVMGAVMWTEPERLRRRDFQRADITTGSSM